jgi:hypothetical protein
MHASPLAQQSSLSSPQSCEGVSHWVTHDLSKHISARSQQTPLHSTSLPQSATQFPALHTEPVPQHWAVPPKTQAGTPPQIETHRPSSEHSSPNGQSHEKSTLLSPPARGAAVGGTSPQPAATIQTKTSQHHDRMI